MKDWKLIIPAIMTIAKSKGFTFHDDIIPYIEKNGSRIYVNKWLILRATEKDDDFLTANRLVWSIFNFNHKFILIPK